MPDIDAVIHALRSEHARSVTKHGDWKDYPPGLMMEKCMNEVWEVLAAQSVGDICGPHGVLIEGLQAANCFVKMITELGRRQAEEMKGEGLIMAMASDVPLSPSGCTASGS